MSSGFRPYRSQIIPTQGDIPSSTSPDSVKASDSSLTTLCPSPWQSSSASALEAALVTAWHEPRKSCAT